MFRSSTLLAGLLAAQAAMGAQWVSGIRYGNGSDGALTVSSNMTYSVPTAGCWGSGGSTQLNLDAAPAFANGNIVLIHQTRGSSPGRWEINKILSGGGSTTLTLAYGLSYTYSDGGSNQAQVVCLRQYSSVTVNSGYTLSAPEWAGNTGGILAFMCNGTVTVNGTINANGTGFVGGWAGNGGDSRQSCGEGSGQDRVLNTGNPAGNGGGGRGVSSSGGGNAQATSSSDSCYGDAEYNAALTLIGFGGGGGGGSSGNNGNGAGGDGGGAILILAKNLVITGIIRSAGNNGANAGTERAGSGGAGGCVLLKTETATLGTNLVSAARGIKGSGGCCSNHTDGSIGRIHLDFATSYTGSTNNPLLTTTQDPELVANAMPDTFGLTSPIDGATLTNPRPTFAWQASTDPEGLPLTYLLKISREATFKDPICRLTEHSATTFGVPTGLEIANGTYYWRVVATDGETYRESSEARSFTMNYTAPAIPAITSLICDPTGGVSRIAGTVDPAQGSSISLLQWDTGTGDFVPVAGTTEWAGGCFTFDPSTAISPRAMLYLRSGTNNAESRRATFDFDYVLDVYADPANDHGGSGTAMRLTGATSYTFKIAANAGSPITVSAWVQRDGNYSGTAPTITLTGNGIDGTGVAVDTLSAGADTWQQLSVVGTPNAKGIVRLKVESFSTTSDGSIWVDDIAVSQ